MKKLSLMGLAEVLFNQGKILERTAELFLKQEKIMSVLTDLQASVAKLSTDVAALVAENNTGASDADLAALKTQIDAIDATLPQPATPATPPAA
jgi:hypothetical protein